MESHWYSIPSFQRSTKTSRARSPEKMKTSSLQEQPFFTSSVEGSSSKYSSFETPPSTPLPKQSPSLKDQEGPPLVVTKSSPQYTQPAHQSQQWDRQRSEDSLGSGMERKTQTNTLRIASGPMNREAIPTSLVHLRVIDDVESRPYHPKAMKLKAGSHEPCTQLRWSEGNGSD